MTITAVPLAILQPLPEGFRWTLEVHPEYDWVEVQLEQATPRRRGKVRWDELYKYSEVTRSKDRAKRANVFEMPLDEVVELIAEASQRAWKRYLDRGKVENKGAALAAKLQEVFPDVEIKVAK